jgi:predicted ATPase/class 3 adenylate cyclase
VASYGPRVALDPLGETVSLLFTDIEGSTRLARILGDDWELALALHHEILGHAITSNHGVVDGIEGDAFFAVFPTAREAVAAASDAQRELRKADWPASQPIPVRMGLHVGEVRRAATGYVGIEIHRTARIAASAHGGQVLLTETARQLAGDGVETEDLGLHRLKDFPEPLRLLHLVLDGRRAAEFPPPTTRAVRPTNVPVLEMPIVGREAELQELRDHLANGTRLMTVTGQGGAGKTRLAIASAEDLLDVFPGGAWFVALANVTDPERMLSAVADILRLPGGGAQGLRDQLTERLSTESTLLVLDNLEQLRHVAPELGRLIADAPSLRVLATSQAPLRLATEHVLALRPLALEHGRRLFAENAGRRRADFDPVASQSSIDAICERLDGWPLAIELAAARTALLTPDEVLARLDRSAELLRVRDRDRPERHRSLQAALQWSFGLLESQDAELCADLSLFIGPFTVADAETLQDGGVLDGLEELLDLSFLRRVDAGGGETRFTMAQALREFARERLVRAGRFDEVQRRHAVWVLGLARETARVAKADQGGYERFQGKLEDGYAALAWARDVDPQLHLQLCAAIPNAVAWTPAGPELETELAIAVERQASTGTELAEVIQMLGLLKGMRGDRVAASTLLLRATALWRELGEWTRVVDGLVYVVELVSDYDLPVAREHAVEARKLAERLGDEELIDLTMLGLAQLDIAVGDASRAEPLITEMLSTVVDPELTSWIRHMWADCAVARGDGAAAVARYSAAIRGLPQIDDSPQVAFELQGLAMGLSLACRPEDALEVDRLAVAVRDHFAIHRRSEWWERLRERHISAARALRPEYVASRPVDDLPAAREWALGIADVVSATETPELT